MALLVHAAKVERLTPDPVTITPMILVHTGPDGANGLHQVLHVDPTPKNVNDEHATVVVLTIVMDQRPIV